MKHRYYLYFEATRSHGKRAIRELVSRFSDVELGLSGELAISRSEHAMRDLFEKASQGRFKCSFHVTTEYTREDALQADFAILNLGGAESGVFRAVPPKDAFDFSTGCPRCGLGAALVKPHVLAKESIGARGRPFHHAPQSLRIFMRTEVGRELVEATDQPWCVRHPVTRGGKAVKEWVEVVPCATMPPLSPKSEGVWLGKTSALGHAGDPPQVFDPCPVCGRTFWDYEYERPTRLVYRTRPIPAT